MTGPDPIRDLIATMFHDLDVAKSRGGYTLVDPHSGTPLARLKPIPQSDRFELFYWSDMRGRWRTFGDFGPLRLTLERANEVFRNEPIFHSLVSRLPRAFFDKVELRRPLRPLPGRRPDGQPSCQDDRASEN